MSGRSSTSLRTVSVSTSSSVCPSYRFVAAISAEVKIRPKILQRLLLSVFEHRVERVGMVVVAAVLRNTNLVGVEMQGSQRGNRLRRPCTVHKVKDVRFKPTSRHLSVLVEPCDTRHRGERVQMDVDLLELGLLSAASRGTPTVALEQQEQS